MCIEICNDKTFTEKLLGSSLKLGGKSHYQLQGLVLIEYQ